MVKLSVVIPNLNYGRYLQSCLDSLRAQIFKDYEVLLVDGGSTDKTFEVLKCYPEVKVIMDVPPQGPVKAVNKAIAVMKGEYFTQLNADCTLQSSMYADCMKILEENPELGMVYTGWFDIDDTGKMLRQHKQPSIFKRDLLLQYNYIDATSMIIRKSCFSKVGVFDERCPWSMDWIMAVKIASAYPVAFLNKPLFYYRVHAGQITQSPKMKADTEKAYKIIRGYYGWKSNLKADLIIKTKNVPRRLLRR